ncbi:hypothetical protein AB2E84_26535 (plasmid) [Escherichia coli]
MKNEHEDPGSFGETTAPASGKSFLKRQYMGKRKLTAVCSHQTRIGNLDAHLI